MLKFYLIKGHCIKCTALSGCYFAKNNMPKGNNTKNGLLPNNCDCDIIEIDNYDLSYIQAECPIDKFVFYIFGENYSDNGKGDLFRKLGFDVEDSEFLKKEYEYQAKIKYRNGDYTLDNLDKFGQNINIKIEIVNKIGRKVEFISGWKVMPEGLIICNTPLGDR